MYISSEFQLGQVYTGEGEEPDDEVILYRPVYVCVPHEKITVTNIDKDGHMSRAGSRISMTRLNDRKFQLDSRASFASHAVKNEESDSPALERSRALLSPDSASTDRGSDLDINKIEDKEGDIILSTSDNAASEVVIPTPEVNKTDDVSLHVEDFENSVPETASGTKCNGTSVEVDITKKEENETLVENKEESNTVDTNVDSQTCKKSYANDQPASITCDHTPEVILVKSDSDETDKLSEQGADG